MKEAYKLEFYDYFSEWVPVELTGICKKVTGGPREECYFYQAQRRLFGFPIGKYWISEENIKFFDPVVETEYQCNKNLKN